jgi:hypothetical protein
MSDISCGESYCEISNFDASESKSCASYSGSVRGVTEESDWLQITDSHSGPRTIIPVQNTESKASVPSSFDWTTEPVQYF